MKKKMIYAAMAGMFSLTACEGNWWGQPSVPEAVEQQFVQRYPTAESVEWELKGDVYEVDFELSSWERSASFSADGKLLRYSEEIEDRYLPPVALELLQSQYNHYKIDEVARVQQEQRTYYEVELEEKDELVLLFDDKGHLLEQQPAAIQNTQQLEQASLVSSTAVAAGPATLPQPQARWELPEKLREVSGIAFLEEGLLACVQDEEGIIYLYDLSKKAITRTIPFAEGGDYEGISVVGNTAFVLRSDGALFEVLPLREGKPITTVHRSVLAESQNTEGLAYDKANQRLLIAPKGYDKQLGNAKGIYAYSLTDKRMLSEPVITIPLDQEKLAGSSKKKAYDVLQPSSLEMNETNGALYLLDAKNHLLLTLDSQGQILQLISLDKAQLRQPEAFAFSPAGELYISSEGGKKGKGVLLKYTSGF